MRRVVVAHNRYVSSVPSGENDVVDEQIALLRSAGVEVHPYLRSSDEIAEFGPLEKAELAIRPTWSRRDVKAFGALLDDVRPDVVHLHNPFPLLSPWIVRAAADRGCPVVQTVHNYRHGCVAGSLFRDGHPCRECIGRTVAWPAVAHGCYRGSRLQSVPMVVAQVTHRPTWRLVDRFLPLTTFMAGQLAEIGLPPSTMTVLPNAVEDPGAVGPPGRTVLFAGRLDPEKGIEVLLDAWQLSGLGTENELVIAGDGPLLAACQVAAARSPGLTVLGRVAPQDVGRLMESSALLVVPSVCNEGFPRVVVEAFARSRPVLSSSVESLACIVDDEVGWLAEPSAVPLAAALRTALADDSVARGAAARSRYLERYRPEVVLAQLLQVYDEVR